MAAAVMEVVLQSFPFLPAVAVVVTVAVAAKPF
jgi:hypothetical protein